MTTMTPEMEALKARLKATWMSGDYGHFAKYLEPGALEFLSRLAVEPGTRMLDVACGAGQIAIPAARAGARVTGIDIASNLIEQARARAAAEGVDAKFEEGDAEIRLRLDNPPAEITISLLTGYFAFFPAELLGLSAVLAAVSAGIYLGWYAPELTTSQVRLQGVAVWEIVQYAVNALLFVLVGLQLPVVIDALGDIPGAELLGYAALVSVTVIVSRFAWVFAVLHAPKWIARRVSSWRGAVFLSWAGMRGAVSLAAALALPFETDDGVPFPGRD